MFEKIGECYKLNKDITIDSGFGETYTFQNGSKFYIGADGNKYFDNGKILLGDNKDFVKNKYYNRGIADWIYDYMLINLGCFEDYLCDYDIEKKNVCDVIEEALDELGFN